MAFKKLMTVFVQIINCIYDIFYLFFTLFFSLIKHTFFLNEQFQLLKTFIVYHIASINLVQ